LAPLALCDVGSEAVLNDPRRAVDNRPHQLGRPCWTESLLAQGRKGFRSNEAGRDACLSFQLK
jgi:hypothetical protein